MELQCLSRTLKEFGLLLSLFFQFSNASIGPSLYCVYGCEAIVTALTFEPPPAAIEDSYYTDLCTNELKIKSIFYCSGVYCSEGEIKAGLDDYNQTCKSYTRDLVLPTYESVVAPSVDLASIQRINESAFTLQPTFKNPIVPDEAFFRVAFNSVSAFYNIWEVAFDFSWSFYGFWGLVISIGIANRAFEFYKHRYGRARDHRNLSPNSIWTWIRRSLVLPATFNHHSQEPVGWCTIPPRLESILLVMYVMLNLAACFPGYRIFANNVYYPDMTRVQLTRYISDRTGILAITNIPILWVFASRNDPFLWITGWSFATYNRFHRWVARMAAIEAIVHGIGYSVNSYYVGNGDYEESWTEQYWYCGAIAIISMSLMLGASVYGMRKKHYDFFLVLHVVLALVFLVALYYHLHISKNEWNGYIWACVATWSLDRLLRIVRVLYCSVMPRFLKGVTAITTYDKASDMVRVDVTDFLKNKKVAPGIFYYMYTPGSFPGWESHPFTLCSWTRKIPGSPASSVSPTDEEKNVKPSVRYIADSDDIRHSFLIRPYEGFTGRLRKRITASQDARSSRQMTVLLEGPYGNKLDLSSHSDVLIIAGGSGITAAISHTYFLLSKGSTTVHVIWAIPQSHSVDEVCENELAAVMGSDQFSMTAYLTNRAEEEPSKAPIEAAYEIRHGRPDLLRVMGDARQKCTRSLAVVTCGTQQMADACRKAIVRLLGEAGPEVQYYNETFTW